MLGSFRRLCFSLVDRRRGGMPFVLLTAFVCVFFTGLSSPAQAREGHLLQNANAQADRSVLIQEHVGWNGDCEAIAHPTLYLLSQPRHGKICARIEKIKITSMYAGTESQCIGHLVRGVQLIYQPDEAYVGEDIIQYAAQYPSAFRIISVRVTLKANPAETLTVLQPEFLVPSARTPQLPGLVPACPQLIF